MYLDFYLAGASGVTLMRLVGHGAVHVPPDTAIPCCIISLALCVLCCSHTVARLNCCVFCTGVSLCEAEASVAAPMTSRQQSITSMISVVAEGRCTLLATYQIFQFIVGYAMAQAFATNLMYTHALQMGNYQYLIQVGVHASKHCGAADFDQ